MKKPDIPANEQSRLEALHALNLLDSPPEERFDRITRNAVRMFGVEVAAVSLVDSEREWFKSIEGAEIRQGDRETSFCAHTILEEDILVVEDATKDTRFKNNPKVAHGLRFYAGVPLHTIAGEKVGSFCIRDTRPRRLNAEKRQSLRDFAAWAETELNAGQRREALDESRAYWHQLHSVLLYAPVPTILYAEDGEVLLLSETWTKISGYKAEEIPTLQEWCRKAYGRSCHNSPPESFGEPYTQRGRHFDGEYTVHTKNGEQRVWEFYTTALGHLPDGRRFSNSVALDVTESRQQQNELQRLHEEWRETFDAVSDPITVMDTEYRIVRVNQAMADLLQKDREDLIGQKCFHLMHELDHPPENCPHQQMCCDAAFHTEEVYISALAGEFLVSVSPIRDTLGRITGAVHVAKDITQLKQTQRELERMAQFAQLNPAPVFQVDRRGKVIRVNRAAQEVILSESEVSELKEVCPAFLKLENLEKALNEDTLPQQEVKLSDGRQLLLTYRATVDKQYVNIYSAEISELKKAQKALNEAKNEAQAANKAKTEFLANMSHELRTPLNSVIGFADLLKEKTIGDLNDKQIHYLENISKSARHLLDLLNDVLDLSKIEANKMTTEYANVDITSFLESTVDMLQQKASEHALDMKLDISEELNGRTIRTDERKLRQIMLNLLSNATKFTPDGGSLTVSADTLTVGSNQNTGAQEYLRISVTDTGVGIPAKDQQHIFERFSQLDTGSVREYQGTGLGLALTQRLVETLGGSIFVESEGEGKGATFTFQIPMAEQ